MSLKTKDLAKLEAQLLRALNFNLTVSRSDITEWLFSNPQAISAAAP